MVKINFKYFCLIIFFLIFVIISVLFQHWRIEYFYNQNIKECMENQNKIKNNNDKDKKDDDDQDKKDDDDICDKKCRLASINSHISMIDTRLNLLEKNSEKNDILIKNNKDNINKTSTELKKLQDEINTAKKELEEATKSNKSY